MAESLEDLKRHPKVIDLYRARLRLKQRGREWDALCPYHSERHPSFQINQKEGIWLCHCKTCGSGGSIIDLIQQTDSVDQKGAIKIIRDYCGEWFERKKQVEKVFPNIGQEETKEVKTYSTKDYEKLETALANSECTRSWLLNQRGLVYETCRRLHFGYRQDVGQIAGDGNAEVAGKGWICFPRVTDGRITGLHYRSIAKKAFCRQPGMATELFNIDTIDPLEPVFVTEGEFDAAILEQAGFRAVSLPNATAAVKPEWKDALLEAECVILAGDNDGPGRKLMEKLWVEMERTYLLRWPGEAKDANQYFLEDCGRDLSVFRTKLDELTAEARSRPMRGIYSLPEMLLTNAEENLADHPNRFRFPWTSVDQMAILAPGSVVGVVATNTGMGKSTWAIQSTLFAARRHQETILNYQAELSQEQVSRIVTAQLLRKHRLELTKEDFAKASAELSGVKYYVGRDPNLNTIEPVLDLIESGIRRLSPTCVVLDNLHFLCRYENDQVKAVENAMQRIKNMAALYKLKFFVIGQPKKSDSKSKGKTIHITDVRGSASFGDDSDAVFTIHRDVIGDWSENKKNEYDTKTKIRLVKVRDKGPGDAEVDLLFQGEIATFSELSYQKEPQGAMDFGK